MRSRETVGLLLGLLGVLAFAGTLPATRLAVVALQPWFVSCGRAAVAGILAGLTLLALRRPVPARRLWRPILVGAACLVFAFPGLVSLALQTVPVVHGGVVLGVLPLATAAFAALLLGERPSLSFWLLALLGAAIVVAFALRDGGGRFDAGDLFLLLAVGASALGYTVSAGLARELPGWEVISWMLVVSLPLSAPIAVWLAPAAPETVPPSAWAGFAYAAVFSQFLGFFAWNAGLAMGGVARVSQTQLLQTFVTLVAASLVNHEPLDPLAFGTAALVIAIVVLGRRLRVSGENS